MQTRVHHTIDFSVGGNGTQHVISGWSIPEPSHTWMVGTSSSLVLDRPRAPFGYILEIQWSPAVDRPFKTIQNFVLEINGRFGFASSVDTMETCAFVCPPLAAHEGRMLLTFHHPTAFPANEFGGNDARELSLCVRRLRVLTLTAPWLVQKSRETTSHKINAIEIPAVIATAEDLTGVKLKTLLHGFETLAGNCDMGLAQRALGFEKISLLRFGGATVPVAIKGLETDFEGLGETLSLSVANNPMKEWMVSDTFGLHFHSGTSSTNVAEEALRKKLKPYLGLLRRKFLDDLDEGIKIFVYADHRNHSIRRGLEHILPLYLALKRRSPQAKLLWVCPAPIDPTQRGSVRMIYPDLAMGMLDLVAAPVLIGGGISVTGWVNVLANAWLAFGMRAEDLA